MGAELFDDFGMPFQMDSFSHGSSPEEAGCFSVSLRIRLLGKR